MAENRRIVVNLEQPSQPPVPIAPIDDSQTPGAKRSRRSKILLVSGITLLVGLLVAAVGGYWWYSNLQKTPTYSLALLIGAARRDDQKTIDRFLDADAVVDAFVPQIEDKAKERYARGLPPQTVARAEQLIKQYLTPVLPVVKEQARREIPRQIKEKAAALPEVSPWAATVALNRVVNVSQSGEAATVKSNLQNRPIVLTMRKTDDRWKIVAVKDEALADRIAQQVAETVQQELAKKPGQQRSPNRQAIEELQKQLEQLAPR